MDPNKFRALAENRRQTDHPAAIGEAVLTLYRPDDENLALQIAHIKTAPQGEDGSMHTSVMIASTHTKTPEGEDDDRTVVAQGDTTSITRSGPYAVHTSAGVDHEDLAWLGVPKDKAYEISGGEYGGADPSTRLHYSMRQDYPVLGPLPSATYRDHPQNIPLELRGQGSEQGDKAFLGHGVSGIPLTAIDRQ